MAIYHLSVQVISRGKGKSCVAAAAYRAGEKLKDERQDLCHSYTKKTDIESEILAPANSPSWVYDREKLWNEVDKSEKRCNARTAREINVALPLELSKEQQKELARNFVAENFVNKGIVADLCFHFNDSNNPHFHVMLTTREINQDGFTKKNREWDNKELVEQWREQWANHANKALERSGSIERIDHRSYKNQGIDQVPTIHLGKTASELQKKGIENERAEINRQIKELNEEKVIALQEYKELKSKIEKEKSLIQEKYSGFNPTELKSIKETEKILKESINYDNANKFLERLNNARHESHLKLSKIDLEVGKIEKRLYSINKNLDELKRSQNEFDKLPKNLFGRYKDKERAEVLQINIQNCNRVLDNLAYKGIDDIQKDEKKLHELNDNIKTLKSNIKIIEQAEKTINEGIAALKNRELREFQKQYKEQFKQADYLNYNGMKNIKLAEEILGKQISPNEMKELYSKIGNRIDGIDSTIKQYKEFGTTLEDTKQALETVNKYKQIADKWDSKLFGKIKFQNEHRTEKRLYDNAANRLEQLGIKDEKDLANQESDYKNGLKEIKSLQQEKEVVIDKFKVLNNALQAIDSALRAEKYKQRQNELNLTKAFRDYEQER